MKFNLKKQTNSVSRVQETLSLRTMRFWKTDLVDRSMYQSHIGRLSVYDLYFLNIINPFHYDATDLTCHILVVIRKRSLYCNILHESYTDYRRSEKFLKSFIRIHQLHGYFVRHIRYLFDISITFWTLNIFVFDFFYQYQCFQHEWRAAREKWTLTRARETRSHLIRAIDRERERDSEKEGDWEKG